MDEQGGGGGGGAWCLVPPDTHTQNNIFSFFYMSVIVGCSGVTMGAHPFSWGVALEMNNDSIFSDRTVP